MTKDHTNTADVVLEGGGVKGIALVGAIEVLHEAGFSFERVAGTSAGAIVGALLSADIPIDELVDLMEQLDYRRFRDKGLLDLLPGGKLASLLLEEGIYEGRFLVEFLDEQLDRTGKATFADLRLDDPGSDLDRDLRYRLVVCASDVSQRRLARLPWDYRTRYGLDPDEQRIADAVRASMSIPFYYEPAYLDYECTDGDGRRRCTSALVDGGMLSNFPIALFDRTDGRPPRWPTFGIKLSGRPDDKRIPEVPRGPLALARSMLSTLLTFHDAIHTDRPDVRRRTIFIDTGGVSAVDFEIDRATQRQLYEAGRDAASRFLDGWTWEHYLDDADEVRTVAAASPEVPVAN